MNEIAWYYGNSNYTTHPVATKRPNSICIYDMSGNVWEWCEGFYGNLPTGYLNNPRGFAYSSSANHRGGAYNSEGDCAVTRRGDSCSGSDSFEYIGFRIAMGGPTYTPEAIDLGLPSGLKWASFNIGACAPEEIGGYYAWGEIISKMDYSWATYRFMPSGYEDAAYLTKYSRNDGKTVLDLEDDVAHMQWGENWRLPSWDNYRELIEYCSWSYEYFNGKICSCATGPNGNRIILPLASAKSGTGWVNSSPGESWGFGIWGWYLCHDKPDYNEIDPNNCYTFYLVDDGTKSATYSHMAWGYQARPVKD